MPKRRPSRSRRRRGQRPPLQPLGVSSPPPAARPLTPPPVATVPRTAERTAEPSVTRFSARDYSYVRRELLRIAVLATAIVIAIVVLSFFLP